MPDIERAVFGVAGPVIDQVAEMTNVPWRVDAAEITTRFAFRHVRLLNDLESLAYSVPVLGADELHELQKGDGSADGNMSVVAAGTGSVCRSFIGSTTGTSRCHPKAGIPTLPHEPIGKSSS